MENPKDSVRSEGQPAKTPSVRRTQGIFIRPVRAPAQKPSLFDVIILNDDTTPMDYVQQLIETHFFKKSDEAIALAQKIDQQGEAICGKYTREIAETKIADVIEDARRFNHPLKCVMRKRKEK